jgi:hypothetical protein
MAVQSSHQLLSSSILYPVSSNVCPPTSSLYRMPPTMEFSSVSDMYGNGCLGNLPPGFQFQLTPRRPPSIQISKTSVCSSCGRLVATADIHRINDNNNTIDYLRGCLDTCGRHGDNWEFCSPCHSALRRGKCPKFLAKNCINVTVCQHYPAALEGLTAIEECLIAICHPVGRILKSRPGERSSPVSYNALDGHMIVMPQDPGPLLHILPSPVLELNSLIKVIWLGKQPPAVTELKNFLQVRKDKVLSALQYLVHNNPVYKDVTTNHNMMESWDNDSIPPEIANNVIHATHRSKDCAHHLLQHTGTGSATESLGRPSLLHWCFSDLVPQWNRGAS